MNDAITIKTNVRVILSLNGVDEIVFEGPNTFQALGYNYLKDALISGGSLDPVQDMLLYHSGGIESDSVNISDLGTGRCMFEAIWGSGVGTELSGIYKFTLKATSVNYTEVNIPSIDKGEDYALIVQWTIEFA